MMIKRRKFSVLPICRVLGVSRANQYASRSPRPKRYKRENDSQMLTEILSVVKNRGTYGYKRVTGLMNRQRRKISKPAVNKKRILRVMQSTSST